MEAQTQFDSEMMPPTSRIPPRRNICWDAMAEIFGYQPLTDSEIKLWGKLSNSLRRAGATRESMLFAAREYKKEFPTASLTPTALEKHYSRCVARYQAKKAITVCDVCGIGGGYHLADCNKAEARAKTRAS